MTLVATFFRRNIRLWLSYPVEAVITVVVYYAIFLVLFIGAKTFGGPSVSTGDTLSSIAVGYVVFFMTQQSYQNIQSQITQESTAGTLEQLALSRYGLLPVLLTDFLVQSMITTLQFGVVLIPIMATTGRWLHFDVVSVVPVTILLMAGVVGLGLFMGGLAMVFKRVGGVAGVLQMSFLFLVAAPVDRYPLLKLLPVAHGNALLRESLVHGRSTSAQPSELLILLVVSAAYLTAGCIVFNRMDRMARDRALLGQY
jgi:ABC-2 type transport system permease protein